MKKHIILVSSLVFFSGCSLLKQDPNIPNINMPITQEQSSEEKAMLNDKWWENFNDTELNSFVEYSLKNNSDLQIAILKVQKFREFLNIKKSDQFPTIDATAGAVHKRTSHYTPPSNQGSTYESYDLGLKASFEIDLFGKLSNAKKGAFEDMLQQHYIKEMIRQRIISDSVVAYYGLQTNHSLYDIAKAQYLDQLERYNHTQHRYENGMVEKSVLLQEESLLQMYKSEMLSYGEILNNYKTAVSILIGKDTKEIFESSNLELKMINYDSTKFIVPMSLPSEILQKRADIKASEAKVKSSAFSVSVARSAYFPSLSLTGTLGYVSGDLDRLVTSNASNYSIGGNLLSPIFNYGRISANIENAKIDQKIALIEYNDTVRKAFGDIKDALSSYSTNKEKLVSYEKRYSAIKEKSDIYQEQYNEGFISHLEFLEVRKEVYSVAMQKESSMFETLKSVVNVYYNLGGGFDINKDTINIQ
ncbi:efflux transporter outer membrane subunit [Arcobacter sp. FWKO B]|uniref:efflux transporter outer membrane subunit n=1 Tax=Arcobacter sp. FWKO B TaxID=2593672 RepID=UPI0018A567F6|nr:TolC family protein [Arcobacter sp. FWKO B]QOG13133.1 TolC family protein [Arcobacter sp. FWKO B]